MPSRKKIVYIKYYLEWPHYHEWKHSRKDLGRTFGFTKNTIKQRYRELENDNKKRNINWSMIMPGNAYNNGSKRCNICLKEKLCIIKAHNPNLLNKRGELISKCRHKNKFYIKNYKNKVTRDNGWTSKSVHSSLTIF